MLRGVNIVTFNPENECEKQDGVKPDTLFYCGLISDVSDLLLNILNITREEFDSEILKKGSGTDDEYCFIQIF